MLSRNINFVVSDCCNDGLVLTISVLKGNCCSDGLDLTISVLKGNCCSDGLVLTSCDGCSDGLDLTGCDIFSLRALITSDVIPLAILLAAYAGFVAANPTFNVVNGFFFASS